MSLFQVVIQSPLGSLELKGHRERLSSIAFLGDRVVPFPHVRLSRSLREIIRKIEAYFTHASDLTSLPLTFQGTPFQQRVWQELLTIPVGHTRTYGEIANRLKTSARAVGSACRVNAIPIVIPCHRVIGKAGVGGYCGQTQGRYLATKQWLLAHEEGTC